jgi:hypothetical protein
MEKGSGFSHLLWDFVDGKPKINNFRSTKQIPPRARSLKKCRKISQAAVSSSVDDNRLCLHASRRHGERSSGELPSPCGLRQACRTEMTGTRKSAKNAAPRAWQRMLSGRRLDLLDPSPLDIEIEDIAHGLARVARWNGQTKGPNIYSVAQHSLLVEVIAHQGARLDRKRRLAVLLHDAPEYVIGDMITPFKAVIGDTYKAIEARLLAAVHLRFGTAGHIASGAGRNHQGG